MGSWLQKLCQDPGLVKMKQSVKSLPKVLAWEKHISGLSHCPPQAVSAFKQYIILFS